MGAAVEDVGHRQRQQRCAVAPEVSIEGHAFRVGGGVGDRERGAQDRVGAEPRFVRCAVQLDEGLVDSLLVFDVDALEPASDLSLDIGDGFRDSLSAVALAVAVAELHRFVRAG